MSVFLRRVRSIALKECKHILRDPFTLAVTLLLPLLFVLFFGFIIDLDYKHIPLVVRDNDQSPLSRRFLRQLSAAGYFDLTPAHGMLAARAALRRNDTAGVLIIKKDFGKNIIKGDFAAPARAQLLLDGGDNTKAAMAQAYMTGALLKINADLMRQYHAAAPAANPAALVRTRFLFNPELNSRWFIVPALNTVIIGFLAIVLTALTVAREWENGSMELLLSTPARAAEIVLGKLIPYFALTLFDVLAVFVLALYVFGIPFLGSFVLFIFACCVYITGALALGLVISVATRNQQAAIQFAFAAGLLPSFIFSGFIFPVENMPLFFRIFTGLFPQRWFLSLSRSMFLSEAGFAALAGPMAGIIIFACVMVFAAVKKFKTDVEP
jgi:ABC-2 type transport system permease protein